jgi:hypothetical protein
VITRSGQSSPVYFNRNAPASGSHNFIAVPGSTYTLTVTAHDIAGTASPSKTATVVVPIDDRNFNFSASWQRRRASSDIAGSHALTSHRNASASVAATGRTYTLVVRTAPSYGKLGVDLFGHQIKVLDLRSSHAGSKRITFYSAGSEGNRTFRLVCLGNGAVAVDALYVSG